MEAFLTLKIEYNNNYFLYFYIIMRKTLLSQKYFINIIV